MSNLTITLSKNVKLYDDTSTCAVVCLSVVSAVGVPSEIFVHEYNPISDKRKFQHTAYYDEMDNIPASINNHKALCLYREAAVTYKAQTLDKIDAFVSEVCADIRRLLTQYKFFSEDTETATELIVIDSDKVVEQSAGLDEITIGGIEIEM